MKMLIPTLALLSSTVMAADLKWNIEGRFDYVNSTVKHESETAANSFEEKRTEFDSGALRLNMIATFNETLSGRFRYRLSTAQQTATTTTQNRDLSFQNVDLFYVDHKNQWFTARIGKHNQVDSLGREQYMSNTDYPTTAGVFKTGGASTILPNGLNYASSNSLVYNEVKNDADVYRVGASALYSPMENQNFTVSLFNPSKSTTYADTTGAGNDAKNSKMGLGIYYNGKFMDGLVQPTLGYTSFGVDAGTDGDPNLAATNKLMSVGVRSVVAGFTVDLDWKQYKRENTAASPSATTDTSDTSTSIWTRVAYTWDNLTPYVNFISDKYDRTATSTASVGDYKRTAVSVGLEIKPYKDMNFNYHVGYTNDVKKFDLLSVGTADKKVTANQWTAGIKFDL